MTELIQKIQGHPFQEATNALFFMTRYWLVHKLLIALLFVSLNFFFAWC